MDQDWITLHRLHFAKPMDKDQIPRAELPGAEFTRTCIGFEIDGRGDLEAASRTWCIMAAYRDEAAARQVFEDPESAIPCIADSMSAWHALAVPLSHRGTVNWRGPEETDSALRCGSAEGPLLVMTSAGYRAPPDPARARRFAKGVQAVLDFYYSAPGNGGRAVFNGGSVDGRNGFTLSFWSDTPAMIAAAYRTGAHKAQLDSHISDPMFDYSSFTRLALQASKGQWDGPGTAA